MAGHFEEEDFFSLLDHYENDSCPSTLLASMYYSVMTDSTILEGKDAQKVITYLPVRVYGVEAADVEIFKLGVVRNSLGRSGGVG